MDRLRRSIRQSFRRGRRHSPENSTPSELVNSSGNGGHKQEQWQPDEAAVRAGLCHFNVKVCSFQFIFMFNRRRSIKAVLYVSGDGLRVVDQENNRGLIVDQTIEKVSFCAPDRNNDKGFAYICRDGTSRRWMCHGFHATKESVRRHLVSQFVRLFLMESHQFLKGERLSHAVGCAFSICLERKKKRDEENMQTLEKALNPKWEEKEADSTNALQRTNQAYQSFRKQIPISERLQDPQLAIITNAPLSSTYQPAPSIAKPRPSPNPALFQRQGSLRAPEMSSATQFRRKHSLRTNCQSVDNYPFRSMYECGHFSFQFYGDQSLQNEPIYEGEEGGGQAVAAFVSAGNGNMAPGPHPMTSPQIASGLTSSRDVFDMIGPGVGTSQAASTKSEETKVTKSFASSHQVSQLVSTSSSVSDTTLQHTTPQLNGFSDPRRTSQINVTTNCNGLASSSLCSSRSKADEWLEDAFRNSLTFNSPSPVKMSVHPVAVINGVQSGQIGSNYSLPGTMVTSGPPPVHPPPPLPTKEIVVNRSLNIRSGPVLDVFGQSVQWDALPTAPVSHVEDPFDIQWSRFAVAPCISSNPSVTEGQRELRT
ncbi:hypothetical protein Angca_007810 [Angiostrongylus cantonensis]|nr:hypothetical protein Angca_007810 [Angiostrongylus cantonensis]